MDVLLHQHGERDPGIRSASLLTLNDNDLLSIFSLFWTQIGWALAIAISGWVWILAFCLLDVLLFVTRWRMRRGRSLLGCPIDGTSEILFTSVNIGLIFLVAASTVVLTQTGSDQASIVAIVLAVGFAGYSAALFSAFTVLASINIAMLFCAVGIGVLTGSSEKIRPLVLLTPFAACVFCLITQQTHSTLLRALRSERDNRQRSLQDPLTKLPNRSFMRDELARHVASIGLSGAPATVAVLCLDLDGFKNVNDQHGHSAGDWVIVHVADILRRCTAFGDTACRIGGDEYVVLLPDADEARVRSVGASIIDAVSEPFDTGRTSPVRIGVSIGASIARSPSCAIDSLLEDADNALYAVKRAGRGHLRFHGKASGSLSVTRFEDPIRRDPIVAGNIV